MTASNPHQSKCHPSHSRRTPWESRGRRTRRRCQVQSTIHHKAVAIRVPPPWRDLLVPQLPIKPLPDLPPCLAPQLQRRWSPQSLPPTTKAEHQHRPILRPHPPIAEQQVQPRPLLHPDALRPMPISQRALSPADPSAVIDAT